MRYIGKEHARAYALIFPRAGPAGPNHGGRARAQSARGVFLHFGRLNSYVTDLPLRAHVPQDDQGTGREGDSRNRASDTG